MKRLNHKTLAALSLFLMAAQLSPTLAVTRRTNPDRHEIIPAALQLTGTASRNGEHWLFEILLNRFGSYFRKEWSGREGSVGKGDRTGFFRLVLISGGFRGEHRRIWAPIDVVTSTGVGHSHGANDHEVAFRLYQNGRIHGYSPNSASMEWLDGKISERFQHPLLHGTFLIPSAIVWSDSTQQRGPTTTVYSIQQVKILNSAEHNVFRSLVHEYFPKAGQSAPRSNPPVIRAQNSALPGLRGNGMTSRIFFMPVR